MAKLPKYYCLEVVQEKGFAYRFVEIDDVQPIVHAHWKKTYGDYPYTGKFSTTCSACNADLPCVAVTCPTYDKPYGVYEEIDRTNYCPNCGARMDEEDNG